MKFNQTWDESESHYNEFKRVLRNIPKMELQNLTTIKNESLVK
jgi:hypothetical protein